MSHVPPWTMSPQLPQGSQELSFQSNRSRIMSADSYLTAPVDETFTTHKNNHELDLIQSPKWSAFHSTHLLDSDGNNGCASPALSDRFDDATQYSNTSTPVSYYSNDNDQESPISPHNTLSIIEPQKLAGLYTPTLSPNAEPTPGLVSVSSPSTSSVESTMTTSNRSRSSTYSGCSSNRSKNKDKDEFGIDAYKSVYDKIRERGANNEALYLLELTTTGSAPKNGIPTGCTNGLSEKQIAANEALAKRQAEKVAIKNKLREEQEKFRKELVNANIQRVLDQNPVLKVETTRKIKPKEGSDKRDPETIAGMKCQLDHDKELEAQRKALKMLDFQYSTEFD